MNLSRHCIKNIFVLWEETGGSAESQSSEPKTFRQACVFPQGLRAAQKQQYMCKKKVAFVTNLWTYRRTIKTSCSAGRGNTPNTCSTVRATPCKGPADILAASSSLFSLAILCSRASFSPCVVLARYPRRLRLLPFIPPFHSTVRESRGQCRRDGQDGM